MFSIVLKLLKNKGKYSAETWVYLGSPTNSLFLINAAQRRRDARLCLSHKISFYTLYLSEPNFCHGMIQYTNTKLERINLLTKVL